MKNTKQKSTRVKVARGVSLYKNGTYEVRKTIKGDVIRKVFTNKTKAIKYYNSL